MNEPTISANDARNLLIFLSRATLSAKEVPAFVEVHNKLNCIANPPAEIVSAEPDEPVYRAELPQDIRPGVTIDEE